MGEFCPKSSGWLAAKHATTAGTRSLPERGISCAAKAPQKRRDVLGSRKDEAWGIRSESKKVQNQQLSCCLEVFRCF